MLSTLVSYKDRGNYGNNKYRGNCSGYLIKQLLEFFQPKKVFDPMCGGGTTGDVCRELKIDCVELDLNPVYGGWDALSQEVGESSDLVFWHPPYHDIIKYSGVYYEFDQRDLSRCSSYGDFINKLNIIQEKLLYSLRKGGRLAILVGDVKKKGKLYSIQKDINWYGSPEYMIIKEQINTFSSRLQYQGRFIPIAHEYVMIFKRDDCYIIPQKVVCPVIKDLRENLNVTWKDIVLAAMEKLGGKASLQRLYQEVSSFKKCEGNKFWREKVRQVLQLYKDFKRLDTGVYSFSF